MVMRVVYVQFHRPRFRSATTHDSRVREVEMNERGVSITRWNNKLNLLDQEKNTPAIMGGRIITSIKKGVGRRAGRCE
jgi:hypothetical protein